MYQTNQNITYKRGMIFNADLTDAKGSEQGGFRPVLIIQNDIGNKYSPTVIVAAITSKLKRTMPTHVRLDNNRRGLDLDSVVILEQIRTLDKKRLKTYIGALNNDEMAQINNAARVSLELQEINNRYIEEQKKKLEYINNELIRLDGIICWYLNKGGDIKDIPEEMREFNCRYNEFKYVVKQNNFNNEYIVKYDKLLLEGIREVQIAI